MPRAPSPCFTHEFPLSVDEGTRRSLDLRLRAACNLYNACLQESLRRLAAMWADPVWAAAKATPKGKQRTALFKAVREAAGFTQAGVEAFARGVRDACWIDDHLGGHDTQTTAARAFSAAETHAAGLRGRPRFKTWRRFRSIASKDDCSVMALTQTGEDRFAVRYRDLTMGVRRRTLSDFDRHALSCRIRTLRIVRRTDTARDRYVVQVVVDGEPLRRRETREGHVGIDLGPSTISAVSDGDVLHEQFCPGVVQPWSDLRRIERAMDRSRRATNPDAFDEAGRYRRGRKIAVRSNRYETLARKRARREAKLAARRKVEHRTLANRILGQGTTIHAEQLFYKAFQKSFGRSAKVRAAGLFMTIVTRKAESAGGGMVLIKSWKTRLSQFDHTAGDYAKKPLSLRVHVLRDGSGRVQRDRYSAFLARHCGPEALDLPGIEQAWPGACELLRMPPRGGEPVSAAAGFPPPPRAQFSPSEPVLRKARSPGPKARARCAGQGRDASRRRAEGRPSHQQRDASPEVIGSIQ